jgi:hypothetical protein
MTAKKYSRLPCKMNSGLALPTPMSVAARSKAWFCGHSLAGVAGSNSTVGKGRVIEELNSPSELSNPENKKGTSDVTAIRRRNWLGL